MNPWLDAQFCKVWRQPAACHLWFWLGILAAGGLLYHANATKVFTWHTLDGFLVVAMSCWGSSCLIHIYQHWGRRRQGPWFSWCRDAMAILVPAAVLVLAGVWLAVGLGLALRAAWSALAPCGAVMLGTGFLCALGGRWGRRHRWQLGIVAVCIVGAAIYGSQPRSGVFLSWQLPVLTNGDDGGQWQWGVYIPAPDPKLGLAGNQEHAQAAVYFGALAAQAGRGHSWYLEAATYPDWFREQLALHRHLHAHLGFVAVRRQLGGADQAKTLSYSWRPRQVATSPLLSLDAEIRFMHRQLKATKPPRIGIYSDLPIWEPPEEPGHSQGGSWFVAGYLQEQFWVHPVDDLGVLPPGLAALLVFASEGVTPEARDQIAAALGRGIAVLLLVDPLCMVCQDYGLSPLIPESETSQSLAELSGGGLSFAADEIVADNSLALKTQSVGFLEPNPFLLRLLPRQFANDFVRAPQVQEVRLFKAGGFAKGAGAYQVVDLFSTTATSGRLEAAKVLVRSLDKLRAGLAESGPQALGVVVLRPDAPLAIIGDIDFIHQRFSPVRPKNFGTDFWLGPHQNFSYLRRLVWRLILRDAAPRPTPTSLPTQRLVWQFDLIAAGKQLMAALAPTGNHHPDKLAKDQAPEEQTSLIQEHQLVLENLADQTFVADRPLAQGARRPLVLLLGAFAAYLLYQLRWPLRSKVIPPAAIREGTEGRGPQPSP